MESGSHQHQIRRFLHPTHTHTTVPHPPNIVALLLKQQQQHTASRWKQQVRQTSREVHANRQARLELVQSAPPSSFYIPSHPRMKAKSLRRRSYFIYGGSGGPGIGRRSDCVGGVARGREGTATFERRGQGPVGLRALVLIGCKVHSGLEEGWQALIVNC